jgi:hypothetical protein
MFKFGQECRATTQFFEEKNPLNEAVDFRFPAQVEKLQIFFRRQTRNIIKKRINKIFVRHLRNLSML